MNYAIFKNEMIKTLKNDKIIVVKTSDMKIPQYWNRDYSQVDVVNGIVELGATMVEDDDESEYLDTPSKILKWAKENGVKSNFEVVFISSNDRRFDYCEFKTNIGKNIAIVSDEMMSESHKSKKSKMKKRYTKKQIIESIKYWKKQLRTENYKKLDESNNERRDFYSKKCNLAKLINERIWQCIRTIPKFRKMFEDRLNIECHEGVVEITADYEGENDPLNPESNDGKIAWN